MLTELKADPFADIEACDEPIYQTDSTKRHHRTRKIATGEVVKDKGARTKVEGDWQEEECTIYPSREARWNGLTRYLPMPWAEQLKPRLWSVDYAGAYCLSCHKYLGIGVGIHALACASDHDRIEVNHQIVLVDAKGREVGRSAYDALSVCA